MRNLVRILLAISVILVPGLGARADVVISEIMYHPSSDNDDDEFLELHNTGPTIASVQGWCFDGIDLCFPAGAALGSGQFFVIAGSATQFQTTYGFAPDYVYEAKLSNSGERVALFDSLDQLVDEVAYTDLPPWPVTPDGLGPSLELVDPAQDNNTPRNWRASVDPSGHSAGRANSVTAPGLPPWISEPNHTIDPQPGEAVIVTARVEDATTVELVYQLDFDGDLVLAMRDDGASNDGAPTDGIYGAAIPGQAAGTLVRYRIVATGATGSMTFPRGDDTTRYDGTAVADPALSSQLPIFQWYMDPADYQAAIDHRYTDETEPAVLYYGGVLYDNIQVRVRGQTARSWPKKHWKFKFPQGHEFFAPDLVQNPADNFDMQSSYGDKSWMREYLAYKTFEDTSWVSHQVFHVRLQQNGQFYGLYIYLEDPDADWVIRNGLNENAARYKCFDYLGNPGSVGDLIGRYEKQSRLGEDYSDLFDLVYGINDLGGTAHRDFLFDNIDLPSTLNYIAVKSIIHDNDHVKKNYFVYRDTEGTGRWTMHPWDHDLTFGRNFNWGGVLNDVIWADEDVIAGRDNVSPSHPLFGDSEHQKYDHLWNRLIDKLLEDPDIRQMYYRRLRSLADELLAPGRYELAIQAAVPLIAAEAELDRQKWGWYGENQPLDVAVQILEDEYLAPRRTHLLNTHRVAGEIPEAQDPSAPILIHELMYNPGGGPDHEFVELYNPSTTESVDLSHWRVEGIGLIIPPGTVLLPQGHALLVANDVAFRAEYGSGSYVPAQYEGNLANEGERIVLYDDDAREVAAVDFSNVAPWPVAPDGGGPSLELIDATQPDGWVSNWAPSTVSGGSPGLANTRAGTMESFPGLFINEVLPVNVSVNSDEQGDFDPWIEIYNGGDSIVTIGGMFLSDNVNLPFSWQVPIGTTICAGCWMQVWGDGEPSEGPFHASFRLNPLSGFVGLYSTSGTLLDYLTYDSIPSNSSYGRYPDGDSRRRLFTSVTPLAANDATLGPLILNEYNAVAPTNFLDGGAADGYWGRVVGNGGDWFELVVTVDHLDIRGWELRISEDTGGVEESVVSLFFSNEGVWSDLRSGTLITVSEALADDPSFDPEAGDWWINVQTGAGASGTFITNDDIEVSNRNWQLTILNETGETVFGPAGEGVVPDSGVGSDEVFKLEEDPGPFITPWANYNDGTSSTFGAPNLFAAGTVHQDFAAVRCGGVDCTDVGGVCGDGYCDTTTGQCAVTPKNEGLACDDGSLCTDDDTCVAGYCTGSMTDCSSFDDACNLGICNPLTGTCSAQPVDQGLPCDDGEACTDNDRCNVGQCEGSPLDCSAVDDSCNVGVCDPGTGSCEPVPVGDGTACDADACTTGGTCASGVCEGGIAISCDDGNPCTADSCDTLTGCAFTADDDQNGDGQPDACDDGNLCTLGDVCATGQCTGTPQDCSVWADACHLGLCDPATGTCRAETLADGTSCDDGEACTGDGSCSDGVCASGPLLDCDDGNGCTLDSCDSQTGCVNAPDTGATCDDGNQCTEGDSCGATGLCDGSTLANGTPCDDEVACTADDSCEAGVCGGLTVDCSGLDDACNVGFCNPTSGLCQLQTFSDGTVCDDGDACTQGETCNIGLCQAGTPLDCDDGVGCTADSCDPVIGCLNSLEHAVCDDGIVCNGPEACDPVFDCIVCPGGDDVLMDQLVDATGGAGVPLELPDGIAVDETGNVYVSGSGFGIHDSVFKIPPGGEPQPILGVADGLGLPVGIDVDGAGNVYVASYLNDRVYKIEAGGSATVILDGAGDGVHPLSGPIGVIADDQGYVYVSGYHSNNLFEIGPAGTVSEILGPAGDGSNSLRGPKGVALDGNGQVWVAGRDSNNVFRVGPGGVITLVLDATGDGSHALSGPEGLSVDGSGTLCVTGNASDNVFCVTSGGAVSMVLDATGDGNGNALESPTCIGADDEGNVYVAGFSSHNAFKVRPDGRVTEIIDAAGDGLHDFLGPADDCLEVSGPGIVRVVGTLSQNVFRVDVTCAAALSCDDGNPCTDESCTAEDCIYAASGECGLSGVVRYYRDSVGPAEPSTKGVPAVRIDIDDDATLEAESGADGGWQIGNQFGAFVVTPMNKFGDQRIADHNGAITSFDASYIAQYAVQARVLSDMQLITADVSGNGVVTSFDAAKVSQFAVQVIDHFDVAVTTASDWGFFRCDRYVSADDHDCVSPRFAHDPLSQTEVDDFYATLFGDVTGNWVPAPGAKAADEEAEVAAQDRREAERLAATGQRSVRRSRRAGPAIAVLSGIGEAMRVGEQREVVLLLRRADGIEALDLALGYSAKEMRITGIELARLGFSWSMVSHDVDGMLRIGMYGVAALEGSGPLIKITVEVLEDSRNGLALSLEGSANEGRIPLRVSGQPGSRGDVAPRRRAPRRDRR